MVRVKYAWALETGSTDIKVAVVDSGVEIQQEDLNANYDPESDWNFIFNNDNAQPDSYTFLNETSAKIAHGTNVAGLIAAKGNNGKGIAGMCWDCKIMNLKFVHVPTDDTAPKNTTSKVYLAFKHAVENGASVINNSWTFNQGEATVPLINYIEYAVQYAVKKGRNGKGAVVVWAAGNDTKNVSEVANFKNNHIVVVSGLKASGEMAGYSNYGSVIDVAGPGGAGAGLDSAANWGLETTDLMSFGIGESGYEKISGTSAAAPVISGLVALMLSANPELSVDEAIYCLKKSAQMTVLERTQSGQIQKCTVNELWSDRTDDPYISAKFNDCYGYGIPDAYEMVRMATSGECSFELKKCTTDEECAEGQFCDVSSGRCFLAKSCSKDEDCPAEWKCDVDSGTCYGEEPEPVLDSDVVSSSDSDSSISQNDEIINGNDSDNSSSGSDLNNANDTDNQAANDNGTGSVVDDSNTQISGGKDESAGCGCSVI